MKRIPRNILPKFEKITGYPAALLSSYLSDKDKKKPGRERCLVLEQASQELGYNFSASDWMFSPDKIKEQLSQK